MTLKTIGEVTDILNAWALEYGADIIEIILVGGQADLREDDSFRKGSDIDLVVVVKDVANPTAILSDLAVVGLRHSILLHPLIMTDNERQEKLWMKHYRKMFQSGRRIYPVV